MSDLTVANEILRQLGGNMFVRMTGAKGLLGGEDFLSMQLPGNSTKKHINRFKVKLMPSDTYKVTFGKFRGTTYSVVEEYEDVYCDQLVELFENVTGLYTHF